MTVDAYAVSRRIAARALRAVSNLLPGWSVVIVLFRAGPRGRVSRTLSHLGRDESAELLAEVAIAIANEPKTEEFQ